MKAVEYDRYGGPEVLNIRERPMPAPGRGQVLVRVAAAALNPKEILIRAGKFRLITGRRFPRRTGFDWAGEVVELGASVAGVRVGDRLFGMVDGWQGGACAEYLVTDLARCAAAPERLDLIQASAVPLASLTALQTYRDVAQLQPGQRVLVNGASGGVGTFAVQIARALGAEVDATTSERNRALVAELGAREVFDYQTLDYAAQRGRYHVIFDVFGNLPFARVRPALTRDGIQVTTVVKLGIALEIARTLGRRQRKRAVVVRARRKDLEDVAALIDQGALRPIVERVVPLGEIAEAHRHLGTRRARGKIVVRIAD